MKKRYIGIIILVILVVFGIYYLYGHLFPAKAYYEGYFALQKLSLYRLDPDYVGCAYNEEEILNYLKYAAQNGRMARNTTTGIYSTPLVRDEDVLNSVSIHKTYFNFVVTFNSSSVRDVWKELYFCDSSLLNQSGYPKIRDRDYQYRAYAERPIKTLPVTPTNDSVSDFMTFLYASGQLSLSGFNQGGYVVGRKVLENATTITVIDTLAWTISNDVPPFGSNTFSAHYYINVDKATQNIEYSSIRPW
jgi:hypothetical protein